MINQVENNFLNSLNVCRTQQLLFFFSNCRNFWLQGGELQKLETFISNSFGVNCACAMRLTTKKTYAASGNKITPN